ncbi:POC1 centriolar protein homolog B-like [Onthophagus taurus]|uniref:POC1 centriolar protein homolog B-like n=1 Tax=Onthophagus taurus TaxID=166361 RepID=UPI0039BE8C2E
MSEVEFTDISPALSHNLKGHKKDITQLCFNPNEQQLVSSSFDHSLMLWNLSSPSQRCYKFAGHTGNVNCVQFSNSGKLIASGSSDQTVRIWVAKLRGSSNEFRAHSSAVNSVMFSPSDDKILTGSNDKSIKLWDTKTRIFTSSFIGHTNWVKCAKFARDETFIASCGDDKTLRIWDINSGQCVSTFTPNGNVNHLAIHSNCTAVAIGSSRGSVRIYDLRAKKLQQHYMLHDNVMCVDWHPFANYLLTSGGDGTMKIVDIMEGKPLYTLEGHNMGVKTAVFSKSGDMFASGGFDKHVMVWKTNFLSLKSSPSTSSTDSLS